MNKIIIENIDFSYADNRIFKGLSLEVPLNGFGTALMGRSGIGKSTFIKLIIGMLKPQTGYIYLPQSTILSYIPQSPVLFEHLSLQENIDYLKHSKEYQELYDDDRVKQLIEILGISDLISKNRNVSQLSGGQKQMIMLLRAMSIKPSILVLDEPLTGLDQNTKMRIMNNLLELCDSYKTHLLYVTHHLEEAKYLNENILYFYNDKDSVKVDSVNLNSSSFPNHVEIVNSIFSNELLVLPKKIEQSDHSADGFICCEKKNLKFGENGDYVINNVIKTPQGHLVEIEGYLERIFLSKKVFENRINIGDKFSTKGKIKEYDREGLKISRE